MCAPSSNPGSGPERIIVYMNDHRFNESSGVFEGITSVEEMNYRSDEPVYSLIFEGDFEPTSRRWKSLEKNPFHYHARPSIPFSTRSEAILYANWDLKRNLYLPDVFKLASNRGIISQSTEFPFSISNHRSSHPKVSQPKTSYTAIYRR